MGEDPSIGVVLFNTLLIGAEGTVRGAAVLLPVIGLVVCLGTWWRRKKAAAARGAADERTGA
ncbi:hypothetical protein [Streptomyces spongiae]|uniref:Uncharacterized protein n=1 Tax=Streptomyces spongiae TaxID=565072 RepID=A0A5N8XY82_9ACTN|nr:hypothetical protein [Streptomyces spongiae]MPY64226.1 hypothetical protein [Streptomyces spongiae]